MCPPYHKLSSLSYFNLDQPQPAGTYINCKVKLKSFPCKKASCLGRPGLAWAVPTGPSQTGPKLAFLKNANEKPALAGPGRPKTDI